VNLMPNLMRPLSTYLALAGLLAAQQAPPAQQPPKPEAEKDFVISVPFQFVLAPVTVVDRDGRFVSGLTPYDFRLFDNGKPQRITEDVAAHPISMVVAIQANAATENVIKQVQRLGSVFEDLVLGDTGEIAILAFDHRVQTLTPFTSEPGAVKEALKKLKPGSYSSDLNDAAMAGVNMLKNRPATRRRVLMLISESRDGGSEMGVRDVLTAAEFANIVIYPVNISHLMTSLTTQPIPNRPDNRPPGAVHNPAGIVDTPTTLGQNNNNFFPLLTEIFKDTKGFFVSDPLDVYSKYTGGRGYSFMKQEALEKGVAKIGEELHSQYLLTYSPNNQDEGGFHQIEVRVQKPDLKVRTRNGYWMAAKPTQ
jgi:VWFA-related protein